ncbi:MAG: hypothetical protein KY452_01170 [Actinobacteria bacterium]|nr:hypothetical protein [Actinomycetota bacterium]
MPVDVPTRAQRRRPVPWSRRREPRRPAAAQAVPRRPGVSFESPDPAALVADLEASDRFCRDTTMGRLYHPNRVSYREISSHDSLHVSVGEGNQVSAHVDRHSPLATTRCSGPECRYSLLRIAAHNVSGMAADMWRVIRGRPDEERAEGGADELPVDQHALLRAAAPPDEVVTGDPAAGPRA